MDTKLIWSKFAWNIYASVALSDRYQSTFPCNEIFMGVPSDWLTVYGDLEIRMWLHAASEIRL